VSRRFGWAIVAMLTLAIVLPGISEPSPWMDEGATVLAVRRGWRGLFALAGGPDLSMLTYYAVAKAWAFVLGWLPTLVAVRTLSAVAMAIAAAALYVLVLRRAGVAPAVLSALLFSSLPSVTRFAQEARPTALLVAFVVLSWLAWDSWQRPVSGGWQASVPGAIRYLIALAGTALVSLFGLFQWPAQVLADLVGGPRESRKRRALQTVVVMIASLVLVGVLVIFAALQGTGPGTPRRIGLDTLYANLVKAVVVDQFNPAMILLLVLASPAVVVSVLTVGFFARYRGLARVATVWAVVPLILGVVIAVLRPNMLQARYWVPVTAPLAILSALGILVLVEGVAYLVTRMTTGPVLSASPDRSAAVVRAEAPTRLAWLAAATLFSLIIGGYLVSTSPVQAQIRQESGHGVCMSPMLAELDLILAQDPEAVILSSPRSSASILMAVRPELTKRNALWRVSRAAPEVWPMKASRRRIEKALVDTDRVIWVTPDTSADSSLNPPAVLMDLGFIVAETQKAGSWWMVQLVR
jgi:hypothetical protein